MQTRLGQLEAQNSAQTKTISDLKNELGEFQASLTATNIEKQSATKTIQKLKADHTKAITDLTTQLEAMR